jgi:hypothetical protein
MNYCERWCLANALKQPCPTETGDVQPETTSDPNQQGGLWYSPAKVKEIMEVMRKYQWGNFAFGLVLGGGAAYLLTRK